MINLKKLFYDEIWLIQWHFTGEKGKNFGTFRVYVHIKLDRASKHTQLKSYCSFIVLKSAKNLNYTLD